MRVYTHIHRHMHAHTHEVLIFPISSCSCFYIITAFPLAKAGLDPHCISKNSKVVLRQTGDDTQWKEEEHKTQVLFFTMVLNWKSLIFSVFHTFIGIIVLPFAKSFNAVSIK